MSWIVPAAMLASKAFGIFGKHKAESAAAEAAKKADDERVQGAQKNRVARTDLAASILKGLQSSLGAGAGQYRGTAAPDYRIDPARLAELQAAPAATHAADPTKGQGWNFAGDLGNFGADTAATYLTGGLNKAFGTQYRPGSAGVGGGLGSGGGPNCLPDCGD